VNVTVTLGTPTPPVDTVATSGARNAVLIAALCGVPLAAAIDSTGATFFELVPQPIRQIAARTHQ
jgi:hypothetical protein